MRLKHITLLILFSIGIKIAYLIFSIGINGSNNTISKEYIGCVKKTIPIGIKVLQLMATQKSITKEI